MSNKYGVFLLSAKQYKFFNKFFYWRAFNEDPSTLITPGFSLPCPIRAGDECFLQGCGFGRTELMVGLPRRLKSFFRKPTITLKRNWEGWYCPVQL
jgi:hypothetical protein